MKRSVRRYNYLFGVLILFICIMGIYDFFDCKPAVRSCSSGFLVFREQAYSENCCSISCRRMLNLADYGLPEIQMNIRHEKSSFYSKLSKLKAEGA